VSVACAGDRTADGSWRDVRLGLGGVAETPVRAVAAEEELEGSSLDDASIAAAGRAAFEAADPASDIRASAAYRRHLVPVYVRRVLTAMRRSAHDEPLERRDIA
jgi:carbon-monoxide dehydrogenase medium subunit